MEDKQSKKFLQFTIDKENVNFYFQFFLPYHYTCNKALLEISLICCTF